MVPEVVLRYGRKPHFMSSRDGEILPLLLYDLAWLTRRGTSTSLIFYKGIDGLAKTV